MKKAREYELRKEESIWLYIYGFYCYLQKTQESNTPSINIVTKNICTLSIHAPYIQNIKPLSDDNPVLKANFDLHTREIQNGQKQIHYQ